MRFKSTEQESHFLAFCNPYTFYFGTEYETIDFIEENRVLDSLGEDLGLLQEGKAGESIPYFEKALQIEPGYTRVRENLNRALLRNQR